MWLVECYSGYFFLFENWIEWGFRFVCLLSRCGVVVIRQLNIICFTISHHPYDKIMMTMIRNLMKLQLFFGTHQQNQINQEKKFVVVLVNTEVVELSVGLCMHFQFVFFLVGIRFGQRFSGPHFLLIFFLLRSDVVLLSSVIRPFSLLVYQRQHITLPFVLGLPYQII